MWIRLSLLQQRIGGAKSATSRRQSDGVWLELVPGITLKMLNVDPVSGERTGLVRIAPGSAFPAHDHPETEECFVLEGVVNIDGQDYQPGDYVIAHAGSRHDVIRSARGGPLLLHWKAMTTTA